MTEMEVTALLLKLADIGVTGIKVNYEGGGDSGAIEYIGYTDKPCSDVNEVDDNIDSWANISRLESLDSSIHSDLEDFVNEKILDDLPDWWNNEGGFGEMCILIPSGEYKINHSIRIIEYDESMYEGSLLNKAEK